MSLAQPQADCPFEGGYDYKIGTSDRAKLGVDDRKLKVPPFKHLLIVFGGSDGLEDSVENDEALGMAGHEASKLFNALVRTTPKVRTSKRVRARCREACPRRAGGRDARSTGMRSQG